MLRTFAHPAGDEKKRYACRLRECGEREVLRKRRVREGVHLHGGVKDLKNWGWGWCGTQERPAVHPNKMSTGCANISSVSVTPNLKETSHLLLS